MALRTINYLTQDNMKRAFAAAGLSVLVIRALSASASDLPAINIDPGILGQSSPHEFTGAAGWSFRTTAPLTITAFGFYDAERDGLAESHLVGFWQSHSTNWLFQDFTGASLISSATIPSGGSAELDGPWRKLVLDAVLTLEPGIYAIAASYASNGIPETGAFSTAFPLGPYVDGRIELGGPGSAYGDFPPPEDWIWVLSRGADLGPMFFIEVPEPSPLSLLFAAALLRLALRCFRAGRSPGHR